MIKKSDHQTLGRAHHCQDLLISLLLILSSHKPIPVS